MQDRSRSSGYDASTLGIAAVVLLVATLSVWAALDREFAHVLAASLSRLSAASLGG